MTDFKKKSKRRRHVSHSPQSLKSGETEKKVIFIDSSGVDWNVPANTVIDSIDAGYNVINFAFYLNSGPFDFAALWGSISESQQISVANYAHSKGAILMVAAGGATETVYPTQNPVAYATQICNWAVSNHLDGVDYDIENLNPSDFLRSDFYAWWKQLFDTSRQILGSQRYVSSDPQAPYLSVPGTPGSWCGPYGGFYKMYQDSPTSIDFFNIQFYNQGPDNYTTYDKCFLDSGINFPGSAINQLYNSGQGIPLEKMIFGTYMLSSDGNDGIHDPQQLNANFRLAREQLGYPSSVMVWQYHGKDVSQTFLREIYASSSSRRRRKKIIKKFFGHIKKVNKNKS